MHCQLFLTLGPRAGTGALVGSNTLSLRLGSEDLWLPDAQDFVTRGGKFLFLYKRPGNRVILNAGGHMMVSPSALEASVQQLVAGLPLPHCSIPFHLCVVHCLQSALI